MNEHWIYVLTQSASILLAGLAVFRLFAAIERLQYKGFEEKIKSMWFTVLSVFLGFLSYFVWGLV